MTIGPHEFLNHVLPSEGRRVCTIISKKKKSAKNYFFGDTNSAVQFLYRNNGPDDAFFACGTYGSDDNRRQSNVVQLRSFWLDIDAGEGKPYASFTKAAEAVARFVHATGLPMPTLVVSGGGIHAWWSLTEAIHPDRWIPAAMNLKAITAAYKLDADPSRTADCASILRAPGTDNWKLEQSRPVYCKLLRPLIDTNSFIQKLNDLKPKAFSNADFGGGIKLPPDFKKGYPDGQRTDALLHRVGYCLGPLKMSEEDTLNELLAWNEHNNPPLDEKKIADTVASIRQREGSKRSGPVPEVPIANGPIDLPVHTKPTLPDGYRWGNNWQLLYQKDPDEEGTVPKIIKLFDHPCYLEYLQNKPNMPGGLHYGFRHWTPEKDWQSFSISAETFHGASGRAKFLSHGPNLMCDWPTFERYIAAHKHLIRNTSGEQMIYEQFGWDNGDNFLLGNKLFKPDGTITTVPIDTELSKLSKRMYKNRSRASLEGWSNAANHLFAPSCEAQAFGLLLSFGTALLHQVTPPDVAGMILSYVTKAGGTGKTTTLLGIASVWGPYNLCRLDHRSGDAPIFKMISTMNSIPIIYDEFRTKDPKYAVDFVYGFTDGRDKQRSNRDGSLNLKDDTWCTTVITTSNDSLVDMLINAQGNFAMANRVLEVPLVLPPDIETASSTRVKEQLEIHAGFAGEAFMSYATKKPCLDYIEQNRELVLAAVRKNIANGGTTDRYYEHSLVTVYFASKILQKLGILIFDFDRIIKWAYKQVNNTNAAKMALTSNNMALDILVQFMNETLGSTMIVDGPYQQGKVNTVIEQPRNGKILVRFERNGGRAYIDRSSLASFCTHRYQWRQFVEDLQELGVLINPGKRVTLGGGTAMAFGQSTCVEIDTTVPILSGGLREVRTAITAESSLPRAVSHVL